MAVPHRVPLALALLALAAAASASASASKEQSAVRSNPFQLHPDSIANCTNPDDVEEDLLKCYTIDEDTGACEEEPSEVDSADRCDCADLFHEDSVINYYQLYYCSFGGKWPTLFLLAFWACFLFYLEGMSTERFLVPVLNDLSTAMHLSHNVAGVTLLALANGAPDVFTSIAAFNSSGASGLGLGSLLGTGMFLTAFVFGWVANVREFTAHRRPLLRDFFFYAGGIGLLFYCFSEKEVELWHALIFVGWYLLYVVVVVVGRIVFQRWKRAREPFPASLDEAAAASDDQDDYLGMGMGRSQSSVQHLADGHVPLIGYDADGVEVMGHRGGGTLLQRLSKFLSWDDRNRLEKFLAPFELPFLLAMRLTIPLVQEETWSRTFSASAVALAPHVVVFAFQQSDTMLGPLNVHIWGLIFTPLLALFAYWRTSEKLPKSKLGYGCFAALSFLMSFVWPFVIANELVDLLSLFGTILNISGGILGVTILSVGNSIQDVFANITLAKDKPKMAAAGCIGGPVFNLLVGVGAAFVIRTAKDYPAPLELANDKQAGLGFLALAISIFCGLVVLPLLFRFRVSKLYGRGLMLLYCAYVLFAVLIETDVLKAL